jgi:tetratricopeptide (TPR) repeat protein
MRWSRARGLALFAVAALTVCRTERVRPPETDVEDPSDGDDGARLAEHLAGMTGGGEGTDEPRKRPEGPEVSDRAGALEAVRAGNPEGAAAFLGEHVRTHADDEEARLALARALVQRGAYDEAGHALAGANGIAAGRARARLHALRGRPAEGEKELRALAKSSPAHLGVRGDLLALLVRTGRRESADAVRLREELYDAYDAGKATTADELLAVARATLARRSGGGYQDANMVLSEAEALEAATGSELLDEILLVHGRLFLEKYNAQDAADTFGMILKRDAWHADALVGLAQVSMDGLRLGAAHRLASEALQTNPAHPGAHALLARIALIEGRRSEARSRVEAQVLPIDPGHTEALAVLAGIAVVESDTKARDAARARALAIDPHNWRFFTALADDLNFLHLYPEVGEVLEQADAILPDDPYVQSARGLNLLHLGDEVRGREALERAWRGDRFNERTFHTRKLYTERIDAAPDRPAAYVDHVEGALSLRLPAEGSALVVDDFVAAVRRARRALDRDYALDPGRLRLEIYETPDDFSIRTVGVPSLGAVGVCFGRVVTTVGPYQGAHNFHQVVWHELAHVYAIAISKGRVPRWFTEGLSEWESELADPSWARESADLLIEARDAGRLRRLSELELAFLRAENGLMMEAAYSKAAYAVRYLGGTYGRPKMIELLAGFATGATIEELFPKVLGKDMPTIEREFEAWFDAELARRSSGWRPDRRGDDRRNALYHRAIEAAREGELENAARLLEELIAAGGDGHFPRLLLARVLLERDQPAAARRHVERAIAHNGEATEPLAMFVEIARRAGDPKAEKRHLADILAIDAMSFEPAARLIALALATDDEPRLRLGLERAIAIAPLDPVTLAGRAHDLRRDAKTRARALSFLDAAVARLEGGSATPTAVAITALAAEALGRAPLAAELAGRVRSDESLPRVLRDRLPAK